MGVYLVTGGAGFIGSHLVDALVARGERVRVLDDFSTGRRENLAYAAGDVEVIEGSVADLATCQRAMRDVEYVLHQAALASVPRSVAEPVRANAVNVDGTLNMLVAARDAGARRFVFAASSSVYGGAPALPKTEEMSPCPLSPYAIHKYTGEMYCRVFHALYGLETIALRYFNVFGPRQDPHSEYAAVIPLFITRFLRDEPPVIHGDGEQSRDFTYIENVVDANLAACAAPPAAAGGVFNIAMGQRTTLNELAGMIRELTGARAEPVHGPPRAGDVRHSHADIGKARRALGFEPRIGLREGIEKTIAWHANAAGRAGALTQS